MFRRQRRWTLAPLAVLSIGLVSAPAIGQDFERYGNDEVDYRYDRDNADLGRPVDLSDYADDVDSDVTYRSDAREMRYDYDDDRDVVRYRDDDRRRISSDYGRPVDMSDYADDVDRDVVRYRDEDRRRISDTYGRPVDLSDYADGVDSDTRYDRDARERRYDVDRDRTRVQVRNERDRREMMRDRDRDYQNTIGARGNYDRREMDNRRRFDDARRRFDEDRRRFDDERRRFGEERMRFDRERRDFERQRQQTMGSATGTRNPMETDGMKADPTTKQEKQARKEMEKAENKAATKNPQQKESPATQPKKQKQHSGASGTDQTGDAANIYAFEASTPKGQAREFKGTVSDMKTVTMNDVKTNRLTLKTDDGRELAVLLSPARSGKDLPVKKGDSITVEGHTRDIADQTVLIASRIDAGQNQMITIQRDRKVESLTGTVTQANVVPNPSEGTKNRVLVLKSDDGKNVIVDLGPDVRLKGVEFKSGQQIKVSGQMASIDNRPLLIADSLDIMNGGSQQ